MKIKAYAILARDSLKSKPFENHKSPPFTRSEE
jgi:hypothetical protein